MIRVAIQIAAAALAIIGGAAFTIEHPRAALFIFAGSYAVAIIACDVWHARHKITRALRGN